MNTTRKSYPSDVTDAEWEFLLPYLNLMREDAPQREYPLRDLFNAIRYVVRTGCQWRFLPHDLSPWTAVYQQARRWMHAGVFEQVAHDLRAIVRFLNEPTPSRHPRSSTDARSNRLPKVAIERATTGLRRRRDRRCTQR
jgi:transposase